MKIVVAIIVYNRTHNVKRWVECWHKMDYGSGFKLVIIDNSQSEETKQICIRSLSPYQNIIYIPRDNIGFDIGTFQDVCMNRLKGFPDYDYLLWCTDDTFPMAREFIDPFIETIKKPKVGIACMKLSLSVQAHVRTTGFMIHRSVAERLVFPADPIITKQQCYDFEHRGQNTMTTQIRKMGLSCEQVAPDKISPMWDSGYWKRLDRLDEFEKEFGIKKSSGDKVTFVCTIYNTYPQIISSLLLQTHKNWELYLIHDGPSENGMKSYIPQDERITFIETSERAGNWGHSLRQMALESYDLGSYVVITNADNYYVPTFIEYMLKGFQNSHTAVATYCDKMTHSYKAWDVIQCRLERGFIDCGGVMVKSEVAKEVGWKNTVEHSADWVYFSDIASRYSWKNFIPVKGNLFIHN